MTQSPERRIRASQIPRRVVAGVVEKSGLILAARRGPGEKLEGKWEFPGGKIEPGETPEQSLAREFFEEFGVTIRVLGFIASSTFEYKHEPIELLAYRAELVGGDFVLTVHDEIRWVEPSKLCELDFASADIPLLDAIVFGDRHV